MHPNACSESCRFIQYGRIHAPRGRDFLPHTHPSHEVVVVRRGQLRVATASCTAVAGPGAILRYLPGEMHHEVVLGPGTCDWSYILYTGPEAAPGRKLPVRDADGGLRQLMALLAVAASARDGASARKRDALCAALHAELDHLQASDRSGDDGLVASTDSYIHAHLAEPLDLERLARAAGLSRAHFARRYRERTGSTAMAAVRAARLHAARELLLSTELNLEEIARRVGVGGQPLLSRLLARHLGMGARDLRRGCRRIGLT